MILDKTSIQTGAPTSNGRRWRTLLTGTALGCSLLTAPAMAQVSETSDTGEPIILDAGDVSTSGDGVHAVYVQTDGRIEVTSGEVSTAGAGSNGIWAVSHGAGDILIRNVGVTTAGAQGNGIVVASTADPAYEYRPVSADAGTGALSIYSESIQTPEGRGIVVDHQGSIHVESGTIETLGSGIYMWANGTVDIVSGEVSTAAGPGVVVYGGEGDVTLDSGMVHIGEQGDAGIYVETSTGDVSITADSTTTTSEPILYGYTADGVVGMSDTGNVTINAGIVSVAGESAWGIAGLTAGTASITSTEVKTGGVNGIGIYAGGSAGATVDSGLVETAGDNAYGIRARSLNGDVVIASDAITTTGNGSTGIFVPTSVSGGSVMNGNITIESGSIRTSGADATGISVGGAASPAWGMRDATGGSGTLSITSDSIITSGPNSWGIAVDHLGPISIVSNSITTGSEGGGAGIYVWAGNSVDIDSGLIETPNGPGIVVYGSAGDVNVEADATHVGEGSDVGVWARTTTGNITIVAGDTSTARRDLREGQFTADGVMGISAGGGNVSVQAGTTAVVGEYAWGVTAYTTGVASITSGTVTTEGTEGVGVYGRGDIGGVTIASQSVTTSGAAAHGIVGSATEGDISITSGAVAVSGADAGAIRATSGAGSITIQSGTATATGNGAPTILAIATSGDVRIESNEASHTGLEYAGGDWTNDAVVGLSDTGNVTIISGTARSDGLYGSAVAGVGGAVSISSDHAITTGDGGAAVVARTNEGTTGNAVVASNIVEASGDGSALEAFSAGGRAVVTSNSIVSGGSGIYAEGLLGAEVTAGSISAVRTGVYLASAEGDVSLTTTGAVTSERYGVWVRSANDAVINVGTDSSITGGASGIFAEGGTLDLTNNGTIRGNGSYDGYDEAPHAGVTIAQANANIVNTGTISGGGFGITTSHWWNPVTAATESLATGTNIENSGTIRGDTRSAIRLIGGGTITNDGTIETGGENADAIAMWRLDQQDTSELTKLGTVTNGVEGTITGGRFGVFFYSTGGEVQNAGTISGNVAGVLIQAQADETGKEAIVGNTGTITGGDGVRIWSNLASATVTNSGRIEGTDGFGLDQASAADLVLTNELDGEIVGSRSGVALRYGSTELNNAGTIRGNGTGGGETPPEGGVVIVHGANTIENSGTISGAQYGLVTTQDYDPVAQQTFWAVTNTDVVNSGTITGETSDGVAIYGTGSVVNSGTIQGLAGDFTDGIQLQYYPGQDSGQNQIGSIVNEEGGSVTGARYGILLAGGGTIENAGTISGGTTGVVLVNQQFPGKTGTLVNSGTINGGVLMNLASATASNTGTIANANGAGFVSQGATHLANAGTISGLDVAIQLSALDDTLTLHSGSSISGAVLGGEGVDILALDGDSATLTNLQTVSAVSEFEGLAALGGYWVANQGSSVFDHVYVGEGAVLDVRETTVAGAASSAIVTEDVENEGLLILNFNSDDLAEIEYLNIYGSGDVRLDGEANFVIDDGVMAFTGTAIVANGSLTLAGAGGLSGDVETSGDGTFVLGDGGTTGSFEGNLVNNGRFIFARTDDYSFLGDFSGTGSFTKMGDGVLTFAGDYSYTGTTVIDGGSVKFLGQIDPETEIDLEEGTFDISGTPQTIAQLSGSEDSEIVVDDSQLTVNQTSNTAYAGAITGDGALVKSGSGTLNLTGNSTYTGPTAVNGGALAVNGSIVSNVTVNDGGTLKGTGTVGGATVAENGTLAPGNSIGTLHVDGDVTFAAGSVYEVEVNADGRSDQILATGEAIIEGGTVEVLAETGTYRPFTEYLILGADGGVDGEFDDVTSNFAFLTPTLTYGANEVRLQLVRNDIDFADVAATENQASTGTGIESLGLRNDLYGDIAVLTEAGARTAFDALSGEAYASIGSGILANGRLIADALLTASDTGGTGAWARALGDWGSFDAAPGVAGLDTDHQGVIGGLNYGGKGFAVGAAFGATKSDYDVRGRASQADVDTKVAGVHAGYDAGPVTARIGGSYAWHDVDASRSIVFPTFSEDTDASYDAKTMQLFGEVGYKVPVDAAVIEPFARIEHLRLKTEGFAEGGETAALTLDDDTRKVQFLSLGLRAIGSAPVSSTLVLEPKMSASWRRGWGDLEGRSTAALDGGDAFDIVGARLPKNALDLDVGVGLRSGNVRVGVSYRGILSNQWNSDGGQVTIGFAF